MRTPPHSRPKETDRGKLQRPVPLHRHWGVDDPAAVEGTEEEQRRAFSDALFILERRIDLFASLPVDKLNKLALRERLEEIGRS